jgi:uncharacterized Zn-finger protein
VQMKCEVVDVKHEDESPVGSIADASETRDFDDDSEEETKYDIAKPLSPIPEPSKRPPPAKKAKKVAKRKTRAVGETNRFKTFEEKWRKSYKDGNDLEGSIAEYCKMECTECVNGQVKFSNWQELKKHYRDQHQMPGFIVCCEKKFAKRVHILGHIARHLNPAAFRCDVCNKNYADKVSLENHLHSHKPIELRPFSCEKCSKSFAKNYQLVAHQIRHIPEEERKYMCPVKDCGKFFASKSILNTHERGVHQNAYQHICEICAKTFKSKMFYERHKTTVHLNIQTPKVQCQQCGAWLKHEESLRSHLRRHESGKNTYVCKICGKQAPNEEALRSHNRYVHQTERNHKCSVCEKAFKKAWNLREHMSMHTGEVLYTCPYCPKTFNSSANMHSHKKKGHKAEWEEAQRLKAL